MASTSACRYRTGLARAALRLAGILCLALPLLSAPPVEAAGKAKPHAAAKKHKAVKKTKAVARKTKATKQAKAGHRKIARAHAPRAKSHRPGRPAGSAMNSNGERLALPGKPVAEDIAMAEPAPRAAKAACAIGGQIYLLADCSPAGIGRLAAN